MIVNGFEQRYALTIWQPWCSAIVQGSKRIENRAWAPPRWVLGHRIWLHAGKRWDEDGSLTCALKGFDLARENAVLGTIIGSARVTGFQLESDRASVLVGPPGSWWPGPDFRSDPWWVGPVGWVLEDVQSLAEPVPAVGKQKLWTWPHGVGP